MSARIRIALLCIFLLSMACTESSSSNEKIAASDGAGTERASVTEPASKEPAADRSVIVILSELQNIKQHIDPVQGVYILLPGPGVTPLLKKIKSTEELQTIPAFKEIQHYTGFAEQLHSFDPKEMDPCQMNKEGFYSSEIKIQETLLEDVYRLNCDQSALSPDPMIVEELRAIDRSLFKIVLIALPGKSGEKTSYKLYLSRRGEKIALAVLDLRECGA